MNNNLVETIKELMELGYTKEECKQMVLSGNLNVTSNNRSEAPASPVSSQKKSSSVKKSEAPVNLSNAKAFEKLEMAKGMPYGKYKYQKNKFVSLVLAEEGFKLVRWHGAMHLILNDWEKYSDNPDYKKAVAAFEKKYPYDKWVAVSK